MKKRIYFIISSVIMIILSIYSIIMRNQIIKESIDVIKGVTSIPKSFQDRIIDIYAKSGPKLMALFSIIVIIASLVLIVFSVRNKLLKHKGFIIFLLIICFFFTDYIIVQLLSIVGLIIIIFSKRKDKDDFPNKAKEIPKLSLEKTNPLDLFYSIVLVIAYFSQFIWSKYLPDDLMETLIIEVLFNIIMIILCILVFYNQFRDNLKIFIKNAYSYFRFILPKIGIAYLFLFVFSLISILVTKKAVSINQSTIESLPKLYTAFAAIIYAPIVEEIIFRGVIRRFIKNNLIFIIVSALSFGLLHTFREESLFNIIIMSLPYCSLGAYLSYIYVKTNNIFSNISSHAIFNTISVIFMIFL